MITLFHDGELHAGATATLSDDAAHHARVRRVAVGDGVQLVNGRGTIAAGSVTTFGKRSVSVDIDRVADVPRPSALTVLVPVADRDRMLLAAEKCAELQITEWQPVFFARSRSVSPRGEGERFREKLIARMRSALEQSGGAWMPDVKDEIEAVDAWGSTSFERRLLLQAEGEPIATCVTSDPMAIAVGPEGGFERAELEAAERSGWTAASLGSSTLRFETAVIAGAAVIRATQLTSR
jgi:16S rRNA (uracil1498-N3)-methyltransferase